MTSIQALVKRGMLHALDGLENANIEESETQIFGANSERGTRGIRTLR